MNKELFKQFENLKGANFVGINNYTSKTSGEVANILINTNISVENAKKADHEKLKNCTEKDVVNISKNTGIDLETVKTALSEMLASSEKNLSAKLEDRTKQSQAQTDAYINIGKGLKLNKESMELHIFGISINKTVITQGTYKTVNSRPKTIAKKAIKKHLDLKSDKFRTFIVNNMGKVKMNGNTLVIN